MPLSLPFLRSVSMVNDCYKPVAVMPDIEDHVTIHGIFILKYVANFLDVAPANRLDNGDPGLDLRSLHLLSFEVVQNQRLVNNS